MIRMSLNELQKINGSHYFSIDDPEGNIWNPSPNPSPASPGRGVSKGKPIRQAFYFGLTPDGRFSPTTRIVPDDGRRY